MYTAQCVLGLIVLYVGCTQSWDVAATHGELLELYTNDTKTDTVRFNSHKLAALTYNEVNNMLLYVDKQTNNDIICGYDISSKVNHCFIKRNGRNIHSLTFDPITEMVFFSDTNERSINWISLKLGSNNYGNLLVKMDHGIPTDVAVDSCRGYVYWINTNLTTTARIERVRFNGSEREVVLNLSSTTTTDKLEPHSLIIDQPTQKMYWIEPSSREACHIYYAHMNGNVFSRIKLHFLATTDTMYFYPSPNTLTVSNTNLIYVDRCDNCEISLWKLGKIEWTGLDSFQLHAKENTVGIAANYKIKERIQDLNDCETLTTPGTPGYIGERCHVSQCENYCLQGNCSVNDEGLPICRCNAGYLGERCEVAACHGYCLNYGVCSLNEEDAPSCECVDGYEGSRCETVRSDTSTSTSTPIYSAGKTLTLADLLAHWRKPKILLIVDVDDY